METWGMPCEDTHRNILEEACGRGQGRRHSWKEELHAGGGTSPRDSGHGQPTPGQGHSKGLWLWVTHARRGTP